MPRSKNAKSDNTKQGDNQFDLSTSKEDNFVCFTCPSQKAFKTKFDFVIHRTSHMKPGKKLPCSESDCDKTFSRRSHLILHLRHHFGIKDYNCAICKIDFVNKLELRAHLEKHDNTGSYTRIQFTEIIPGEKLFKYQCDECEVTCTTEKLMQAHILSEHRNLKPYKCQDCDLRFPILELLQKHAKRHQAIKEEKFKCPTCGKFFSAQYVLKNHLVIHTNERKYECSVCNRNFKSNAILKNHLLIHTGERRYPCNYLGCDRKFKTSSERTVHVNLFHEKKYNKFRSKCQHCEMAFPSSTGRDAHIRKVHSIYKEYQCPFCCKIYQNEQVFKFHVKNHTGENRVQCKVCELELSSKISLESHMRTRHIGNKPYKCEDCNVSFARSDYLKKHRRSKIHQ